MNTLPGAAEAGQIEELKEMSKSLLKYINNRIRTSRGVMETSSFDINGEPSFQKECKQLLEALFQAMRAIAKASPEAGMELGESYFQAFVKPAETPNDESIQKATSYLDANAERLAGMAETLKQVLLAWEQIIKTSPVPGTSLARAMGRLHPHTSKAADRHSYRSSERVGWATNEEVLVALTEVRQRLAALNLA